MNVEGNRGRYGLRWLLFFTVFLVSCSASSLTSVWESPLGSRSRYQRLLVVGIEKSPGSRRAFEDELVLVLEQHAIEAVPSYRYFESDERIPFEQLRPILEQHQFDGVLASRVLGVEREFYSEPAVYPSHAYRWYDPYSLGAWNSLAAPGRIVSYTQVILETNLYDANSGRLIWSAQSETVEPSSARKLARSVAPLLLEDLSKRKLID